MRHATSALIGLVLSAEITVLDVAKNGQTLEFQVDPHSVAFIRKRPTRHQVACRIASDQSPIVPAEAEANIVTDATRKLLPGRRKLKGVRMPDNIAVFATVILLLPMMYFLLAAPAFLLVALDIRAVVMLMRAMFNGYFLTLAIAGAIGTIAVAAEGRLLLAAAIGLVAAIAASSRRWFLQRLDAGMSDRDAGDANAPRRLRRLHWGGMLSNAVQLVALVASIPHIAMTPA